MCYSPDEKAIPPDNPSKCDFWPNFLTFSRMVPLGLPWPCAWDHTGEHFSFVGRQFLCCVLLLFLTLSCHLSDGPASLFPPVPSSPRKTRLFPLAPPPLTSARPPLSLLPHRGEEDTRQWSLSGIWAVASPGCYLWRWVRHLGGAALFHEPPLPLPALGRSLHNAV